MGTIIAKTAAREDIEADLAATLENATTRGVLWQASADALLRPTFTLIEQNLVRLRDAEKVLDKAKRVADAADATSDDRTADVHDRVYNIIGRPGVNVDPIYALMFPGGSGGIRNSAQEEQPVVMDLVVELLRQHVHPLIDPAVADGFADELDAEATTLAAAVATVRTAKVRVAQITKAAGVLARLGQIHLSRLKKHWRSIGRSETDIHEIIPDRGRPKAEPAPPATTTESAADPV